MKREESDFLISKKEMEGKSAKQIIFELKRLEGTRVELKENQKENRKYRSRFDFCNF